MLAEAIRATALALPEAFERPHRGQPTFWVHDRIFCIMPAGADHITVKLEREDQLNMIEGHPQAVRPARLYSHHGWTSVHPEACDDVLMALLLRLAWSHVAPRRLVRAHLG
ncbi:MmcQ/YjbR family DNA-binding protein [Caulobacter sp. KR2-114]|uniref:MmcQ/YjbR family DNA-binding protein n=1 Tax=Caulobacter sp. KR2-114 TaxID=3400912 RepID=UPI003C04CC48